MSEFSILKNNPAFHDFYLIHKGVKYGVNTFVMSSVSTKARELIFSEKPVNFIEIPPVDGNMQDLINLLFDEELIIDQTNCRFLNFVSNFLGIDDLSKETKEICSDTETLNNILIWADSLLQAEQNAEYEINLVATQLDDVYNNPYFQYVSCNLIYSILSSRNLNISNLHKQEFINSLISQNPQKFQRLSSLIFTDIQNVLDMNVALMSTKINMNDNREFIKQLLQSYKKPTSEEKFTIFAPSVDKFTGVLSYLNSKAPEQQNLANHPTNQTIAQNDEICLSWKSVFNARFSVTNIILYDNPNASYCSNSRDEEYITVQLMKSKLKIDSYVIQSDSQGGKGVCPLSWRLEGSVDGKNWITIDDVKNNQSLHGSNAVSIFPVKTNLMPFSYFKLTQFDTIHSKNKRMFIAYFDLFGKLYE